MQLTADMMKRCPFCGSAGAKIHSGTKEGSLCIKCTTCGARTKDIKHTETTEYDGAIRKALECWNRRYNGIFKNQM